MKCLLLFAVLVVVVRAQVPNLGFCPEYLPMPDFDMDRFLGIWYEAERYFQLTEVASRCVTSNYTKTPSGKYFVINELMSRFTGVKRVLEGEIRRSPLKGYEGKIVVKYATFLLPETQYNVLETDYDNYAVLWSCSGIGPMHTQSTWIMTRQRHVPSDVFQKAYAVLDKRKISTLLFMKTDQEDCAYLEDNLAKPTQAPQKLIPTEVSEATATEEIYESTDEPEETPTPPPNKCTNKIRPHIATNPLGTIVQMSEIELEINEKLAAAVESVEAAAIQQPFVDSLQADEAVRSVPEIIMKIADQTKQDSEAPTLQANSELVKEKESPKKEAVINEYINNEIPIQPIVEEPNKSVKSSAVDVFGAVVDVTKEAPSFEKEPVVAHEAKVGKPEIQSLKKSESVVEEIEIAQL